jgi:hypothetical protein
MKYVILLGLQLLASPVLAHHAEGAASHANAHSVAQWLVPFALCTFAAMIGLLYGVTANGSHSFARPDRSNQNN